MGQAIEVSADMGDKAAKIESYAESLMKPYEVLTSMARDYKSVVSDSRDINTFAAQLIDASVPIVKFSKAMEDYADILRKISRRYQQARDDAVQRAKKIPK